MISAPIPANEADRLAVLRGYQILDTPPERAFDDLTVLAAHICGTPIALVSLVDADRQWFKSRVGLDVAQMSRDLAFCAHALSGSDLLIVGDAMLDARFSDNPLVTGDPKIRFYAGAPLVTADGYALGTLCVIDRVPRTLTEGQEEALRALRRQAIAQLELRRHVAELRDAVARLSELDRMKSQFVSTVSHELRTPLTSIRGALHVLQGAFGEGTDAQHRELVGVALGNTERLVRITNDILEVARMEAGRGLELVLAPCQLADLIATACENAVADPSARKRVRVHVADDVPGVIGDADRLVQALVNLISNALKFTDGLVSINAESGRHFVTMTVHDQGPGIAPEDLGTLFQPFHRLTASANLPGTGLGLVIAKGIIDRHGGNVGVSSQLGTGTTFTVTLPVQGPERAAPADALDKPDEEPAPANPQDA